MLYPTLSSAERALGCLWIKPPYANEDSVMAVRRELFVFMPFTEPWLDGSYSFIRRVVAPLGASQGQLYLYRADEIAVPGRITDQIREDWQARMS